MCDTPTLLRYAISTNQDPIQASDKTGDSLLTLQIVVSNSTHKLIECQSISFSFLQGTDAKDLFSDSTGIGTSAPKGWSLSQSGSLFTATPATTKDGQIGADGVTFVLSNIQVNQQPGTTDMTITEVTTSSTGTQEIPLAKFPMQFEVGQLTAQPPIVDQGDNTTLFWSGSDDGAVYQLQYADENGDTITISHPKGEPDQPLPATGNYEIDSLQVTPVMNFYLIVTLTIAGQDRPLTAQRSCPVTVKLPKPAINSFSITANPIVFGQQLSFILNWDVVGSYQITANDGPQGTERVLPIPNNVTSYQVFPTQLTTIYTLTVSPPGKVEHKEHHGQE